MTDETPTTPPPGSAAAQDEFRQAVRQEQMLAGSEHLLKPLSPAAQALLKRLETGENEKPQAIIEHQCQLVEVTAEELREAIQANPDHPHASIYASAISNAGPAKFLYVEQPDLQALLTNRKVRITDVTEGGVTRRYKYVD